ncbi:MULTISPECIES: hypothetical protein [Alicyclobacillus]|uniref:Uncharacterized protein n=1 Tax=Alicyclobacillus acidoterrestris (strain ATCC 49025 / DSM 3922 / CIP 106132 / NCIMB 13137 / GD3B) TaxID=1356854 RepID=T0DHR0_ALIAG|nr:MULTISPECIES: hypothetical protein [Alicyclobacillus]EPZ49071.1 hypothetical protein N007_04315 [Alicyclobacillus acidoterrestris ATCC 49025]UNO47591.1 hypothetical protein K1I37_12880 [Alicyclobacillus acidoterrestris]
MNVLMVVDELADVDALKALKPYFDPVEDLQLTVLYITDDKSCIQLGTDEHPHFVLPDAELIYRDEIEDRVLRTFRPWHERVHFRHEVGDDVVEILRRVIREASIDLIALNPRQHTDDAYAGLPLRRIVLRGDEQPVSIEDAVRT